MTDDDLGRIAYERWRAEMSTAFTPDRPPWHRLSVVEQVAFIAAARAVRAAVLPAGAVDSVTIDRETAELAREIATIARDQLARGAPGFGAVHHRVALALTAALGEDEDER